MVLTFSLQGEDMHVEKIQIAIGGDDLRSEQLSWSAVNLLLALHAKAQRAAADHVGQRYSAKIHEVVAWVEDNLAEDLTIEQAAGQFGLSRSLLTREFRLYTGRSFVDYRNIRRVQKAAMALISRSGSVTQAALDSGFVNLSHFHRQFKAYFGLTPAAFRRRVIEEGSAGSEDSALSTSSSNEYPAERAVGP